MRTGLRRVHLALILVIALLPFTTVLAEIKEVDSGEARSLLDQGVALIDVRTPGEWKQTGVIEGSHLLTFFNEQGGYDIAAWMAELGKIVNKDQPFMLICHVGTRTASITHYLDTKTKYERVINITKGIQNWIESDYPTVPATTHSKTGESQ